MDNDQITVSVHIRAIPEMQKIVRSELLAIVKFTHSEEGRICFDLNQLLNDPSQFSLSEIWVNRQAWDEHLTKPYVRSFLERSDELLAKPVDISVWKMISTPKPT